MLIDLILEGKVEGRIDQVGMQLELDQKWVILSRITSKSNLSAQARLSQETIRGAGKVDRCHRRSLFGRFSESLVW